MPALSPLFGPWGNCPPPPPHDFGSEILNTLFCTIYEREIISGVQVKLGLSVPLHADVRDLRELLSSDTGIPEPNMLITEIDDAGFHRTFSGTNCYLIF